MSFVKIIPKRTCIGCNSQKEKKELIRIVKNKDEEISIDKTGRAEGRGAYICNDIDCLNKAIKNKKIEKTFKMKIENEIYENLRGVIIDK
ncbi:MAG TPA: YlxR family protein [Clostridia bacterium]|nr:YlxR family protein [Clostridia bacterium]